MLNSIIRKLMVFLSFWYLNKNIINKKEIDKIHNIINKKIEKLKLNQKNLKKTHLVFNKKIIKLIERKKLSNFLRIEFIQKMFFLHNRLFVLFEFLQLKKDPEWSFYKKIIIEDEIGDPVRYFLYPKSSGNKINHIYHLKIFRDFTNAKLRNISEVYEFGGGYGCMARIFSKINKKIKYTIFDTEYVNLLQYYYLKNNCLNVGFKNEQFRLVNSLEKRKSTIKNSLFVANWSISETPINFRKKFFNEITSREYFLISFQEYFENIDNLNYFYNLKSKLSKKFHCKIIRNKYYNGNLFHKQKHYFFVGKKI